MQHVFRTAALVRGSQPYGLVVDDLQKDNAAHLYQWGGMMNGGVWQADVPGLDPNEVVLGYRAGDPNLSSPDAPAPLTPQAGDPLLLVYALGMKDSGQAGLPLLKVERVPGPSDKKGNAQYYDRLMISQQTTTAAFRVLLLPYKSGDALPKISYDASSQTARVDWGKQSDEIVFQPDSNARTNIQVTRGNKVILSTKE
jgi:hypothetical protein